MNYNGNWQLEYYHQPSSTLIIGDVKSETTYKLYLFEYMYCLVEFQCWVSISSYHCCMSADTGLVYHHYRCHRRPPGYLLHKLSLQSQLPAAYILEALRGEREGALWCLRCGIQYQAGREKPAELLWEQEPWSIPFPQPQGVGGDLCTLHLFQERAVLQHPAALRGEDRQGPHTREKTCHGVRAWNRDELEEEDVVCLSFYWWIQHRHSSNRQAVVRLLDTHYSWNLTLSLLYVQVWLRKSCPSLPPHWQSCPVCMLLQRMWLLPNCQWYNLLSAHEIMIYNDMMFYTC